MRRAKEKVKVEIKRGVTAAIDQFSRAWPSMHTDFRTPGDDSWKEYALTLRNLVAAGEEALPSMKHDLLANENRQVRAICARALGYSRSTAVVDALRKALIKDSWPTVRLLAADSLGKIHSEKAIAALRQAEQTEEHNNVKIFIQLALDRELVMAASTRESLLKINKDNTGSAVIGQPAPLFKLENSQSEKIALSQFINKKPVALFFLYGHG
jgi:HEAT repeats